MIHDLRWLGWLQWRQLRRTLDYWLASTTGYEADDRSLSNRLYGWYLIGIGVGWVVLMWSFATDQATQIGQSITPIAQPLRLIGLPWLIFGGHILAIMVAWRNPPLQWSLQNIAYIAGMPIRRSAIVMVHFFQALMLWILFVAPSAVLVATALAQAAGPAVARGAGLRAFIISVPLSIVVCGTAWMVGLLRFVPRAAPYRWLVWPVLLGVCATAYWWPVVWNWPGQVFASAIVGTSAAIGTMLLLCISGLTLVLLLWLGAHVNMVDVVDASMGLAWVRSLGWLAWSAAPELMQQARAQSKLASTSNKARLPVAWGGWMLVMRSGLVFVRRPRLVVSGIFWYITIVLSGTWVLLHSQLFMSWVSWVFVAGFVPPTAMLSVFQSDAQEAFLRQLVPFNNAQLFGMDIVLPCCVLALVTLVVWLAATPSVLSFTTHVVFSLCLLLLLAICRAIHFLHIVLWKVRISYKMLVYLTLGILVSVNAIVTNSVFFAAMLLVVISMLLFLLYKAPRIRAAAMRVERSV